ncbi:protogenin B-like [Styela clava]
MPLVFAWVAVNGVDLMTSNVRLKSTLGAIITLTCTWMYSAQAFSTQPHSPNHRLNFALDATENHVVLPEHDAIFRCSDQFMLNVTTQWLKDGASIGTYYHTTTSKNNERRNSRHKKHMRHRSRYIRNAEERLSSWPHGSWSETSMYTSTTKPQIESQSNSITTLPLINKSISSHKLTDINSTYTVLTNGSLFIRNIKYEHSGEYKCLVHDQHGKILRRKFKVIIAKLPQCSITPSSQSVKVGGAARFQCLTISDLNVTYSWTKNGKSLPQDHQRFRFLSFGVLQIFDVSHHDTGSYRCYAKSVLGEVESKTSRLSVVSSETTDKTDDALDFKYQPQNVTVFPPKRSAIFECLADQPNVTYGWIKRVGKICPDLTNCPIREARNNLILDGISSESSGEYVCIVRKLLSQSPGVPTKIESSAFLKILEKPVVINKPVVTRPQQLRSSKVRLACRIEGNPPPNVYWMKDGVVLEESQVYKNNLKVGKLFGSSYLHLVNIRQEATGYYQCIGENQVGAVSTGVKIDILIKEDIPPPENVTATAISPTEIFVEWNRPNTNKNITAYSIEFENDNSKTKLVKETHSTRYRTTVAGLHPYRTYVIIVLAYTRRDTSHPSHAVKVRTMESVPSATVEKIHPQVVNSTTVLLTWPSIPRLGQCGIITKYKVIYTRYGAEEEHVIEVPARQLPSDDAPVTEYALIPNLIPGENYGMSVTPSTRIGYGEESSFVEATLPEKIISKCSNSEKSSLLYMYPEFLSNGNNLKVFWKLMANTTATAVNITLKLDSKILSEHQLTSAASNITFLGVDSRKAFIIDINLIDNLHRICETTSFAVLPPEQEEFVKKELPTNLVGNATKPGCINITWNYNKTDEDVAFSVRYQLVKHMSHEQKFSYKNSNDTSIEICGLKPYSGYEFAVAVLNNANMKTDDSFYAKLGTILRTIEEAPNFPTKLSCYALRLGKVDCSWVGPSQPNGEIISYTLLYAELHTNDWTIKTSNYSNILLECLKPGYAYKIKVFATNIAGRGQSSAVHSILVQDYDVTKTGCVFEQDNPEYENTDNDESLIRPIGIGIGIGLLCIMICILLLKFFLPVKCSFCAKHGCKDQASKLQHVNGSSKADKVITKQNGHIVKNGVHKHENGLLEEQRSKLLPNGNSISFSHEKNGKCKKNGFKQHPNKKNGFHKPTTSTRNSYPDEIDKLKYETSSTVQNGRTAHRSKNGFKTLNFGSLLPSSQNGKAMAVPQNNVIQDYSCNQPLVLSHPIPDHKSKTTSTTSGSSEHGGDLQTLSISNSAPTPCKSQTENIPGP